MTELSGQDYAFMQGYEKGKDEAKPKWVNVKDGLPNTHDKVLTINNELHDICRYEHLSSGRSWFSLCWNKSVPDEWITHWMPLPPLSENEND